MAGLVDTFCIQNLSKTSIDFLLKCVETYGIAVTDDRKGDKPYLLKVVVRHLTSEAVENSADQGAALFLQLYNELGGELKKVDGVKQEENVDGGNEDELDTLAYKLRTFKINGTIGNPGQKNCLSYSSLCYQIAQGEKMRYTAREIHGGIIKAIEPGNPFRDVLELAAESFDKAAFMRALRSHFQIRKPNDVFNELRTCVQGTNESAHAFACRCVALKKKVEQMAQDEDIPFDLENLRTTFFKTIYSGLRQTNIRHELRTVLMEANLSDDRLLLEVSEACANEEERLKKLHEGNSKTAKVSKITCESDSDEPDDANSSSSELFSPDFSSNPGNNTQHTLSTSARKRAKSKKAKSGATAQCKQQNAGATCFDPVSSAEISKMTAAFQQMTAANAKLTAEVNLLKEMAGKPNQKSPTPRGPAPTPANGNNFHAVLQNSPMNPYAGAFSPAGASATPRRNSRVPFKCQICSAYNVPFCIHCLKCCEEGHKAKDCPRN